MVQLLLTRQIARQSSIQCGHLEQPQRLLYIGLSGKGLQFHLTEGLSNAHNGLQLPAGAIKDSKAPAHTPASDPPGLLGLQGSLLAIPTIHYPLFLLLEPNFYSSTCCLLKDIACLFGLGVAYKF